MSVSQALATPVGETVESSALVPRNGFHPEPRCRVCRNDALRRKVNDQLSVGTSYAQIVRALGEDNAKLAKCDRVTIDSIRNHTGISRFSIWPAPPIGRSLSDAQWRTASTSSKGSPRHSCR